MSSEATPQAGSARPIAVGAALGLAALAAVLWWGSREPPEVGQYFPRASEEAVAAWTEEWHRKGDRWADVPDPPGDGPVVRARYWLARDRYDMEVRRRGQRFVVVIGGVAGHIYGGPWSAYGEGRISGDAASFRGAVATFSWSCLGLRYRHASDGIGRLIFDADGEGCAALYMAWEAPEFWAKSYGVRHGPDAGPPAYGTIEGQIPLTPQMRRLPSDGRYRARVRVTDLHGAPIAGALVQIKGRGATRVVTDARGSGVVAFRGDDAALTQAFSAGATGFLNGESAYFTGDAELGLEDGAIAAGEVVIELARLDIGDHDGYVWNRASGQADTDDVMACGTCHPWHYDQWYESRHARMADNGHVTWERARMLRTDPSAPDDCVGCHQPAAAASADPPTWKARGVMAGNHCDFCHKIQAVLDAEASGVFGAYRMARPDPRRRQRPGGIHHVFGAAPDVTYAYMGASYNPLFASSHLCAGCHQGGGRHADGAPAKIDTFEEWKAWAASQPDDAVRSCADCHMPAGVSIDAGNRVIDQMAWDALHRADDTVHDHRFLGTQPPFAALALDVTVRKERDETTGEWIVEVAVTNRGAGHKVPTGTWSRHVVVGVWAESEGTPLRQVGGDRARITSAVPEEALAPGDWRSPGGLVLGLRRRSSEDVESVTPVFWAAWPPEQLEDTRLAPAQTRVARCRFAPLGEGEPTVEVRIVHRRGWLPGGAASVPWTIGPNDPPPEVLWMRIRR